MTGQDRVEGHAFVAQNNVKQGGAWILPKIHLFTIFSISARLPLGLPMALMSAHIWAHSMSTHILTHAWAPMSWRMGPHSAHQVELMDGTP